MGERKRKRARRERKRERARRERERERREERERMRRVPRSNNCSMVKTTTKATGATKIMFTSSSSSAAMSLRPVLARARIAGGGVNSSKLSFKQTQRDKCGSGRLRVVTPDRDTGEEKEQALKRIRLPKLK